MSDPPFPTDISHSPETLRNRFTRFESGAGEPKTYRFRAGRAPSPWQPQPVEHETPRGSRPLARLVAPAGQSAGVRVDAIELDRDVNPADWLEIGYEASGAEILKRRVVFGPRGKVADLLVRCDGDNGPTLRRGMIVKDGPRMFRVEARAAEDAYAELAEDLLTCLASFKLLHPEGTPTAEPVVEENLAGPVPFRFQRLDSWQTVETGDNDQGTILHLASRHEEQDVGRITIEVRKKSPEEGLQNLARDHAERLKAAGIHLTGAPVVPTEPPERFQAAAVFTPSAKYDGHAFDSPVLLFESDEALAMVALFGPTRQESPEWWAINKRAFEIVRDSLNV